MCEVFIYELGIRLLSLMARMGYEMYRGGLVGGCGGLFMRNRGGGGGNE